METTDKPRWRDRVKDSLKEREIKKTITTHWSENKGRYIAFGAGTALTGALWVLLSRETHEVGTGSNSASFNFKNTQTINVTTVLNREGSGHPGWPVRNKETNRIFFSQRDAANYFGIPEGNLSSHLHGKYDDANGLHFERVSLPTNP